MEKIVAALLLVLATISFVNAQEDKEYSVIISEGKPYLAHGSRTLISFNDSVCYEFQEELSESVSIRVGEKFIKLILRDEMFNPRGIIIFDKKGNQINYEKVQKERKKYYKPYVCCVYVEELNGRLIFYDIISDEDQDYDCYYDSQTDFTGLGMHIPRYYIYDYETDIVQTIILKNKCLVYPFELIKDGKIVCE